MTVFLFTDIEGSTRLMEQHGPEMLAALRRHDALLDRLVSQHGGRVVKNTGDGVFAAFEGGDPIGCALEIQRQVAHQPWGGIGELRLRTVLHAGQVEQRGDDYHGLEINRTVRLLAVGWGGQILLTPPVVQGCTLPPGAQLLDHGLHQLKDLSEPQQVFELKHPDLPVKTFPALRSLSGKPHNLPAQTSPFVGRVAELAEVTTRLEDPACRLLTLVGPGGMGKTRLALQAAAEMLDDFGHGAHFVALAPLNASEFLVPAIAEALHYSFHTREVPRIQLLNYLREKQILLVMDNFEHILDGAELVSEILQTAPRVKILATSRERLNLRAETIIEITGLRYPSDIQAAGWEDFSAVKLFLQNARRTDPAFAPNAEDRIHITRICQLVEGIPLGLELASAWVRVFTCQDIADQLTISSELLSTTMRDHPERHRSMRAVCDYSWNLLTEPERQAFGRLAVFQGPFDWKAVQAVAQTSLQLFTALLDKSLIRRSNAKLYEMHSLLRQYAAAKLSAHPDEETGVQMRHGHYHAAFLAERLERIQGQEQVQAVNEIGERIQDLRAAWKWAVDQSQFEVIAQSQACLHFFFSLRGWHQEGLLAFETALKKLEEQPDPWPPSHYQLLLHLLANQAHNYIDLGRLDEALTTAERSLELARQYGDPGDITLIQLELARVIWLRGDYVETGKLAQECLERARQEDDQKSSADALSQLGTIHWASGDYTQAAELTRQALAIYRQVGSPSQVAGCLDRLGVIIRDQGHPLEAHPYFIEACEMYKKIGSQARLAYVLNHLGSVEVLTGNLAESRRYLEESVQVGREIGEPRSVAYSLADLASVAMQTQDHVKARDLLKEAIQLFNKIGDSFGITYATFSQGRVYAALSNNTDAYNSYLKSLHQAVNANTHRWILPALTEIACLLHHKGQRLLALKLLGLVANFPGEYAEEQQAAQALLAELAPQPSDEETAAIQSGKTASLSEAVDALPVSLD